MSEKFDQESIYNISNLIHLIFDHLHRRHKIIVTISRVKSLFFFAKEYR